MNKTYLTSLIDILGDGNNHCWWNFPLEIGQWRIFELRINTLSN